MKFRYLEIKVFLAFMLCISCIGKGQQQGIFLTWQDYQNNKIIPVENIKLNHLLSGTCVDATQNGKAVRYCKDSIFGYRDENSKTYRFYKEYDDEYQIVENLDIVIYVIYKPTYTSKGLSEPLLPAYFFSKNLNTEIIRLTVPNLINAYPENHKFHHELEDEFKNGKPLSIYDDEHHMFLVNYILSQSLIN